MLKIQVDDDTHQILEEVASSLRDAVEAEPAWAAKLAAGIDSLGSSARMTEMLRELAAQFTGAVASMDAATARCAKSSEVSALARRLDDLATVQEKHGDVLGVQSEALRGCARTETLASVSERLDQQVRLVGELVSVAASQRQELAKHADELSTCARADSVDGVRQRLDLLADRLAVIADGVQTQQAVLTELMEQVKAQGAALQRIERPWFKKLLDAEDA